MEATSKVLRPYQARLVADFIRAPGDVLVEQPTGSGKSLQIVTLIAMHLGRRFSHAIISAPQEQIELGFVHRNYVVVEFPFPSGLGVRASEIETPEGLIQGARRSTLGASKRLRAYLRQAGPSDHALVCTHAALNRLGDDLPDELTGRALFIDEAHHAPADGLQRIVSAWRQRGGQLYFFTATPYRSDGRPVRMGEMRVLRRSLAEQMDDGFAPRHMESEIVALGRPGDVISGGQFAGEEAPPPSYLSELVTRLCARWTDDGRPKAIVRVPPMRGGSGGLVARLKRSLESHGARVLDATGVGASIKNRFLDDLGSERGRTFSESRFDVMIGIQRVLEGTDWPVCSAVYCVGMPGSLNTVVLLLGRAMRLKGEDYPAAQRDRARLVFFVPCGGGSALLDELSFDHSRHALLTCCFLADHEVGQEWIVLREVRRGIEKALGNRAVSQVAADAEVDSDEPIDPVVRAEVELAMADAREQVRESGAEPTLSNVLEKVKEAATGFSEDDLGRIAVEVLATQAGPISGEVCEAIRTKVAARLRIDPMVKRAMADAFAAVLEEFRSVTLDASPVLEAVGRQVHSVTGGQMREFAERLRAARDRRSSKERALGRTHQRCSELSAGRVADEGLRTWQNNVKQIKKRHEAGEPVVGYYPEMEAIAHDYGLSGIFETRDDETIKREAIEKVTVLCDRLARRGFIPNKASTGEQDRADASLISAIRRAKEGLGKHRHYPEMDEIAERHGFDGLFDDQRTRMLAKTRDFCRRYKKGDLPTAQVNDPNRGDGQWLAAKRRVKVGNASGTWYPEMDAIAREEGLNGLFENDIITDERAKDWVSKYFKMHGDYPTTKTGIVEEARNDGYGYRGVTWQSVHNRYPLDKLIDALRPPFTPTLVANWDRSERRDGRPPISKAGTSIIQSAMSDGYPLTGSAINSRLVGQHGTTIAQLFGRRRPKSHFSLEMASSWLREEHAETGSWPSVTTEHIKAAERDGYSSLDFHGGGSD